MFDQTTADRRALKAKARTFSDTVAKMKAVMAQTLAGVESSYVTMCCVAAYDNLPSFECIPYLTLCRLNRKDVTHAHVSPIGGVGVHDEDAAGMC